MSGVAAALVILLIVFGLLLPALVPLLSAGIALVAGLSLAGTLSNILDMASFTSQLCTLIGLGVGSTTRCSSSPGRAVACTAA